MHGRRWPTYPQRPSMTIDQFRDHVGGAWFVSDWFKLDQELLDGFANTTGDDAFIHTDPNRAGKTRFKGTIAHGLLTLSVLPFLLLSATPQLARSRMGVNYGYDKVRFLQPVPGNARVRGKFRLVTIEDRSEGFVIMHFDAEVEIEGEQRPALVVRWLLGRWLERDNG
jgi:acyl dehydratase